jgi:hypothetical protein
MAPKLAPQMESFFSDAMGTIMGGVAPRCIAMALHGLSLKIFYMCHGSLSPNRLLSPYLRLQRETSGTEWHSSNTIYFWATALRGDLPLPPRPHDAASLPAQTVVDWFGKLRGQRVTPNPCLYCCCRRSGSHRPSATFPCGKFAILAWSFVTCLARLLCRRLRN